MKFILAGSRGTLYFGSLAVIVLLILCSALLLVAGFGAGWFVTVGQSGDVGRLLQEHQALLRQQRQQVEAVLQQVEPQMDDIYARLARVQAQMTRINALGTAMLARAGFSNEDFDFNKDYSGQGGAFIHSIGPADRPSEILVKLQDAIADLAAREANLRVLAQFLSDEKRGDYVTQLSGWPVQRGWISSHFGKRIDPINGTLAFHHGLDFAGVLGDGVVTVAAGIVSRVQTMKDYGIMVEIDHGNHLRTRYAHNMKVLVEPGDIVAKGQRVALMGETGRSTGPHVHFEVLRFNRRVNPVSYIKAGKWSLH